MPIAIEDAWPEAERIVFDRIAEQTGTKEGATAFLSDVLPPSAMNIWRLSTGGGDAQTTWGGNACFGFMRFDAIIEGRYKDRKQAQLFAGQVMSMLNDTNNFFQTRHIQWFRISEFPRPTLSSFFPANQGNNPQEFPCWIVTMPAQIVFNTSDEYNS